MAKDEALREMVELIRGEDLYRDAYMAQVDFPTFNFDGDQGVVTAGPHAVRFMHHLYMSYPRLLHLANRLKEEEDS